MSWGRFGRKRPPRLRTVLLLSNLAVLALPVGGLWVLRLYESALVRQTESELVAQAAVLAGDMRERLRPASVPRSLVGPAQPTEAALHLARRPGLDLASDPVLPSQPDDSPGSPPDLAVQAAGTAIAPVLHDAQGVTLSSLRVTDCTGVIVATTGSDGGRSLAAWPEVAAVLAGAPVATGMHRREPARIVPGGISRVAGLRVFVALPITNESGGVLGAVVLSRTPNTLGSALWGKREALAALLALLLAGGLGLAAAISRLVTRPLGQVVVQAGIVAAGGSMAPLVRPGTREVAALSAALTRMADTLARRAGTVAGLAAGVSHEFKTPLAAIRGAGELLEDHVDDLAPAERARLLRLVGEGADRLDHLVRRLVELACADVAGAMPQDRLGIAVAPTILQVADRFRAGGLVVACDGDGRVAIAPDALDAVLSSLLDNVVTHAPSAAVNIAIRSAASWVQITVADDGPGIPASYRGDVFEPFFTTARDRGGTGLGLPIVRALVTGAGGQVTLLPGTRGTAFRVDLPQA